VFEWGISIRFFLKPIFQTRFSKPVLKNGEISFSGVIPGGFSGVLSPYYKGYKPGKVFSLIFLASNPTSGKIT